MACHLQLIKGCDFEIPLFVTAVGHSLFLVGRLCHHDPECFCTSQVQDQDKARASLSENDPFLWTNGLCSFPLLSSQPEISSVFAPTPSPFGHGAASGVDCLFRPTGRFLRLLRLPRFDRFRPRRRGMDWSHWAFGVSDWMYIHGSKARPGGAGRVCSPLDQWATERKEQEPGRARAVIFGGGSLVKDLKKCDATKASQTRLDKACGPFQARLALVPTKNPTNGTRHLFAARIMASPTCPSTSWRRSF